ncbi:MAG: hypothetical protein EOP14_06765 [Pseudomonas sp.]|nr:MAG: hypothetical protein EOP14_06765 [Pseudomonas sp.]
MRILFLCALASMLTACGGGFNSAANSGATSAVPSTYLKYVEASPNGWTGACAPGGAHNLILDFSASGDVLYLDLHSYDSADTNCSGPRVLPSARLGFLATGEQLSGQTYYVTFTLTKIASMVNTPTLASYANSVVDANEYPGVTGWCGLTDWSVGSWRDVTSTICWSFDDGDTIGTGDLSSITFPTALNHGGVMQFEARGNQLATDYGLLTRK